VLHPISRVDPVCTPSQRPHVHLHPGSLFSSTLWGLLVDGPWAVVVFKGCGDEGRQENVKLSNTTKMGMFRAGSINFDNLNTSAIHCTIKKALRICISTYI